MTCIQYYFGKQLLIMIGLSSILLLSVDLFFYFINEMRYIGEGDYNITTALLFIALTIPRKIYIMFHWSVLIGSLLSLGNMVRQNEFIPVRMAGYSLFRITYVALKAVSIVIIMVFLIGEFLVPPIETLAQNIKTNALSKGNTLNTKYGIWVRNNNNFIYIEHIDNEKNFHNITRYEKALTADRLNKISNIKKAVFINNDSWQLIDIKNTNFKNNSINITQQKMQTVSELFSRDIIKIAQMKHLERLSLLTLLKIIKSRTNNNLDIKEYQLAFWTKIIQPFTIAVMVVLAIPFVFGPLRSASQGHKLLIGILLGFLFHSLNSISAPIAIVYNIPVILAAATPTIIFLLSGCFMITRIT